MLNESNVTIEVAKGIVETQTATNFEILDYAMPLITIISIIVTGFIAYYSAKMTNEATTQNLITQMHKVEIKENIKALSEEVRNEGTGKAIHECMDSVKGIYIPASLKNKIKECLYLFSKGNVPGNDNERLLRFLRHDLEIDWAENAEIRKSEDDKVIRISNGKNSAVIEIDEKNKTGTLKIGDGITYDLKVKKENGKLNIYENERLSETKVDVISDLISEYISPVRLEGSLKVFYSCSRKYFLNHSFWKSR